MNINEDNELNNYQIMYVTPVEAYTLMESSMDGLSEEQVSHRLKKYGKNEISKKKQSSMFKKLISSNKLLANQIKSADNSRIRNIDFLCQSN